MKDLQIDILPSGEIQICRCDPETNKQLMELIAGLLTNEDKIAALEEFFAGAEDIELLLGEEPLCG